MNKPRLVGYTQTITSSKPVTYNESLNSSTYVEVKGQHEGMSGDFNSAQVTKDGNSFDLGNMSSDKLVRAMLQQKPSGSYTEIQRAVNRDSENINVQTSESQPAFEQIIECEDYYQKSITFVESRSTRGRRRLYESPYSPRKYPTQVTCDKF